MTKPKPKDTSRDEQKFPAMKTPADEKRANREGLAMPQPRRTASVLSDTLNLRRAIPPKPDQPEEPEPLAVAEGPVSRVVELTLNPSRNKIREVTVIDRLQGRLLPMLDVLNRSWEHLIEIAVYRHSPDVYERTYKRPYPVQINLIDEYVYRIAQWQKSVAGTNLKEAINLALAEIETKGDGGEEPFSGSGFED